MVLFNNLVEGIETLLQEVHFENKPPQLSFKRCCKKHPKWGARDRKLVGKVVYDTLRWKRRYCWSMGVEELQPKDILELLWVWSVVEKVAWKNPPQKKFTAPEKILTQYYSTQRELKISASIPDWLDDLGQKYYPEQWEKECEAFNSVAPTTLRVNTMKSTKKELQKYLSKEGISTIALENYPDAIQCEATKQLTASAAYQKGWFEIQDANSQLVAYWMAPKENDVIFDICAGAGGKTLHLATLLKGTGKVYAMDALPKKLEELEKRSRRNGLHNITVTPEPDTAFKKQWLQKVDGVLIDSPCSGLGVLRRHPEHKWIMNPERIAALNELQAELLQIHSEWVKPKGHLLYATCSILPSENEMQIDEFLNSAAGAAFKLVKATRLLTHSSGHDGFFIAKLQRQ